MEPEETVIISEKEDNSMEVVDNSVISRNEETKQEDTMLTLKRKKKMKIEKSGDPQHEQTRSSTRRTTLKLGKT